MALPKPYRLRHRHDFSNVYRYGTRHTTDHLSIRAFRCPSPVDISSDASNCSPPTRFGIAISQKVSKRAVVRNRIKRRLHSAINELRSRLRLGWQIVIVVRSSALECEYQDFLRELEQILINLEVIDGYS